MLAASLLVALGLMLTYRAKTRDFAEVTALIEAGEVVNLSTLESSRALAPALAAVYPDPADRRLAAAHIYAYVVRRRARQWLSGALPNVGFLNTSALAVPARDAERGGRAFRERLARSRERLGMTPNGRVRRDTATTVFAATGTLRVEGRVLDAAGRPMAGVTVTVRGSRTAETRTGADGRFRLTGFGRGDSLVVRPVARYLAFTPVVFPRLDGNARARFEATEHRIPLFENAAALQRVKPRLVVRDPATYTRRFWRLAMVYFAVLYGLHLFWFFRRFTGDPVLLPVAHLLTGLALMLMLGLQDPLRDLMRAQGFVTGIVVGGALLGLVSGFDFQHKWWRRRTFSWLGLGVAAAAALFLFGSGPTGSEAKVNLVLPLLGSVQPVALIQLTLVLFLAGYFAQHWEFLRELRQRNGLPRALHRLNLPRVRDALPVVVGILGAVLVFFALRDMGPALVVACTFLVLYGIARGRWPAVGLGFAALAAVFWLTFRTRAVTMVAERIEMLLSPWENFARGGDHLAHAFWAMATGGLTGQGLGLGHPGYIPAAHTDMVLPALGEELGLLGLVTVFALYAVLVIRALHIALRARGVYSLFLGLSVALILFFQVLLIAGGAFGMIPLSGVVTPFLSFGKSSMAAHFVMLGMLMSLSAHPASAVQVEAQSRHFRRPVRYVTTATLVLFGGLAARAAYIQTIRADAWAVKPALVVRGDGGRAYVYNPRILDARHALTRGTIYDRNGVPLATSRWEEIERFRPVYESLGVDVDRMNPTDPRQYPFEALTFYLLGDVRTRVKWGAKNSLYAENTYLSHLRGYDNHPRPVEKRRTRAGEAEPIVRYDYAELVSLVRYGTKSGSARALLRRNRDLYLTIDVRLQARVAEILAERAPEGKVASVVVLDAATGDVLASVTHPLPRAAFTDPAAAHADAGLFDRGFGKGAKPPGSTFKLVTAIAALRKDRDAVHWTHTVHARDRYARRHEPTGSVDMARGLVASSNVYFAHLAREVVGADSLLATMELFGFGLGGPSLTRTQKRALLRKPDNLRQAGFGQGPVTGSPLEAARVSAAVANGGALPPVRWVRRPEGDRRPIRYVLLPPDARTLAAFMRRVVTDREGTAHRLRDLSVPMAGKTGTAEEKTWVMRDGERVRVTLNHAWFTGFAPYVAPGTPGGPQIAVAVLVENGGAGGAVAAPIAGAVAEAAADLGLIPRDEPQ